MSDFKLCENGHYFPSNLSDCPYCPKSEGGDAGTSGADLGATQLDSGGGGLGQTQVFGGGGETDLNRTQIFGGEQAMGNPFGGAASFNEPPRHVGRKLVGWLVSFTIDEFGSDFRLYEGRNIIGSDTACDIIVTGDSAVSGKHLTILHRMGHFKFRDEFSTNGTFINDVFEEEGTLDDGDMIRVGETIFKFRSIA